MKSLMLVLLTLNFFPKSWANPAAQMNSALQALTSLMPYMSDKEKFFDPKNETEIANGITTLQTTFKNFKHESVLKNDVFAPSYLLINEHLAESKNAFLKNKKKEFSLWRLKELTTLCLDCHTRLPTTHPSSFAKGAKKLDETRFTSTYNLALAQLIVRQYEESEANFIKVINDKLAKNDKVNLENSFRQILMIEAKILKNPKRLKEIFQPYVTKAEMPKLLKDSLINWMNRLNYVTEMRQKTGTHLKNDEDLKNYVTNVLAPLKNLSIYDDAYDVDLLISSGLISNYLYSNPKSVMVPEMLYWMGWLEKRLHRQDFFGSGDLFLKQCIRKYPNHPRAKDCYQEYKDIIEFEFTGSGGTYVPEDLQLELDELKKILPKTR
ncbi:MAG: hypothetical protein JNM93_11775 [Bacteriovoracaceae bacterium]|nr:hypothetical protein [Bacteriovoracaceae bacterium]